MLNPTGGVVSLRSQWQGRLEGYSPSGNSDPLEFTFRLRLSPAHDDPECCHWYYGCGPGSRYASLEANTTDNPDKISVEGTEAGFVLDWVFPLADMQSLLPGGYAVSITAELEGSVLEMARYVVAVR